MRPLLESMPVRIILDDRAALLGRWERSRLAPGRRTLARLRGGLPDPLTVETRRDLYEVGAADLLEVLHRVPDSIRVAMLIGHNPGLEDLATALAGPDSDPGARKALARKFSTGALATLAFDGTWATLAAGGARLTRFMTPKDLV